MATLFPKVEEVQRCVDEALKKQCYDVEDHYLTEGVCQACARHCYFKDFMLFVIIANTLWIAVETDHNKAEILCKAPAIFQIVDNLFCIVFVTEILIRFLAFRNKWHAWRDNWFIFDGVLVAVMVWEAWTFPLLYLFLGLGSGAGHEPPVAEVPGSIYISHAQILRTFRLVRLVRVARTTRLFQSIPELQVLAEGMIQGVRSVFVVLCLLMLVIYIFAVTFTMTLSGTEGAPGVFDTVPQSVNFLLLCVLCGPDADFIQSLLAVHWIYYLLFLLFLSLALLVLMNMLIGILCDVVATAGQSAKEDTFMAEVEFQTSRLAEQLDRDGSGTISREEFDIMIKDQDLLCSFSELGVDIVSVAIFAKFLYEQTDEISYINFAKLVGKFRGTKSACVKDMMDVVHCITIELLDLEAFLVDTFEFIEPPDF
jgi:hypothetical protein